MKIYFINLNYSFLKRKKNKKKLVCVHPKTQKQKEKAFYSDTKS